MSYSHSDVAHEFANKTGNKTTGSNVFYRELDGDFWTIYSYGSHFAIATLLPGDEYGMSALFTMQDYSNSTSKHKSIVRSAISHYNIVRVPENTDSYYRYSGGKHELHVTEDRARKDIEFFSNQAIELVGKQQRARKRDYTDRLITVVDNARRYAELFNVKPYLTGKLRKVVFNDLNRAEILSLYFSDDHLEQLKEKRKAERRRNRRQRKAKIQAFRNYERAALHNLNSTYLRLSEDGEKIETSRRVVIDDLNKARALYELAKKAKELEDSVNYKGTIAGWTIERITKNGTIKSHCHTIPFSESERIATKLGWE